MKKWKGRFFFIDRRAIPDAMCWRHHDSDISDPAPKDGFDEADVVALTHQPIDIRGIPSGLLFCAGLAVTWEFPKFYPVFKDPEGNVATRIRKAQAAAKRKTKNRGSEGTSGPERGSKRRKEKATDHIPCPTPLQTIEGVTSDASRGEDVSTMDEHSGVLGTGDDRLETMKCDEEVALERPERHLTTHRRNGLSWSESVPLLGDASVLDNNIVLDKPVYLARGAMAQPCSPILLSVQNFTTPVEDYLSGKLREEHDQISERLPLLAQKDSALVYAERVSSDRLSENEELRANFAFAKGRRMKLSGDARSEEELRELMMRMNGLMLIRQEYEAEYESMFSKLTQMWIESLTLSEKSVARSSKTSSCPSSQDAPKAGSGVLHLPPNLFLAAAEVAE
ncbi:hypothetical protein Tco_1134769 [Tanacetum coccineum]